MDYKNANRRHKASRLDRIEKKCDRIILELSALRRCLASRSTGFDRAIDIMHRNARRMRTTAAKDARVIRKLFRQKTME